ncbi:MAG TPA: hypothetical protein DCL38_10035 [Lachnospiraceae bacterium]|nr:hypothetical protein [Lachnospiraceae bacterium]
MIHLVSILLFMVFFLLSFIAGFALRALTKQRGMELITIYSQGMVVILLIFVICCEFCAFTGSSIKFAGALWLAAIFTLELFFLFMDRRRFPSFFRRFRAGLRSRKRQPPLTVLFGTVVFLIFLLQVIFLVCFEIGAPYVSDNARDATFAFETGRISASSPVMMLYAWLSGLVRVHPMTMIYTIAPVIMLPMYYGLEWSLAKQLFKEDERNRTEKCLFMMFIFELLHIFGYQSWSGRRFTLLLSYFSETAFLVHGILPFILWFSADAYRKRAAVAAKAREAERLKDLTKGDTRDPEEDQDMNHRIVNSRNIGIALLVVTVLFSGMIFILNRKINSLHETAAGLTESLNSGLRTYEFIPEGQERAAAFIVRQSNGGLIVIGGGGAENGNPLYDLITEYGNSVDSWYLNGSSPSDTGAYEVCRDRGLTVEAVYTLNINEFKQK